MVRPAPERNMYPHPGQSVLCQSWVIFRETADQRNLLIDDEVAGNAANYCAPTCRTDLDCPSGYGDCGGVQIVDPNQSCTTDANAVLVSSALEALKAKLVLLLCYRCRLPTDFCFPDLFGGGGSTCSGTGFPCQTDADCGSTCSEVAQTADGQPIKICETNMVHAAKKQALAVRTSWATQSATTSIDNAGCSRPSTSFASLPTSTIDPFLSGRDTQFSSLTLGVPSNPIL